MTDNSAPAGTDAPSPASLAGHIKAEARRIGFDLVGIAPAVTPDGIHHFRDWLERDYAGAMSYLPRRAEAYEHPRHVLETVRSIVMLAVNYRTDEPSDVTPGQGRIAHYAWGTADYHDVLRAMLAALADALHRAVPGCRTRGIVDTAPLLERDFARLAGLGWFGKNTMLIHKRAGSWLFLAGLLTDVALEPDAPHDTSHCGTCTRCLDACPTDAFAGPYVLDARKCISYLTIELRSAIPTELRPGLDDWLFGCDVCQDVCPWNRKAPRTTRPEFQPAEGLAPADAAELLRLDPTEFRARFRDTPLARPGRAGLLRNAALVLGNSGDRRFVPALVTSLRDAEPLIRGAAAWALGQLGGPEARSALQSRAAVEDNPDVLAELHAACQTTAT